MDISSCCGEAVVEKLQPDLPNFTDDEYSLEVPVWVCSKCGAVIVGKLGEGRNGSVSATESGPQSEN